MIFLPYRTPDRTENHANSHGFSPVEMREVAVKAGIGAIIKRIRKQESRNKTRQ